MSYDVVGLFWVLGINSDGVSRRNRFRLQVYTHFLRLLPYLFNGLFFRVNYKSRPYFLFAARVHLTGCQIEGLAVLLLQINVLGKGHDAHIDGWFANFERQSHKRQKTHIRLWGFYLITWQWLWKLSLDIWGLDLNLEILFRYYFFCLFILNSFLIH